jgi:hypothetical protein
MIRFQRYYFVCLLLALCGGIMRLRLSQGEMGAAFWGNLIGLFCLIGGGFFLGRRRPLKASVLRGIQPLSSAEVAQCARRRWEG